MCGGTFGKIIQKTSKFHPTKKLWEAAGVKSNSTIRRVLDPASVAAENFEKGHKVTPMSMLDPGYVFSQNPDDIYKPQPTAAVDVTSTAMSTYQSLLSQAADNYNAVRLPASQVNNTRQFVYPHERLGIYNNVRK